MISNLFQLLDQHYEGFSKTYRIICDYVRSNYLDLSYLSIVELSRKIDVSVGSITGFCKAIGFAAVSYTHLDVYKRQIESCRCTTSVP